MLTKLVLENFTAFPEARLEFARHLNVIVGVNGMGKTHLLKLPYAVVAMSAEEGRKRTGRPTKAVLEPRLAEKLVNVLRPESLGRLVHRRQGGSRCDVMLFGKQRRFIRFNFATSSRSEVTVDIPPGHWHSRTPVYLPTHELLTVYPGFLSLYENHYVEFEETWRDTCLLLGAPELRGRRREAVAPLLEPLEEQLGGRVVERNGRFYLAPTSDDPMEMPLVAEGWRKVAMLARLIATGSLGKDDCLFWDEPESNLGLCEAGVQVFVATHSLFLLREFEILLKHNPTEVDQRYFALHRGNEGVEVSQSSEIGGIDPLVLLDEDLSQSDRFVEEFMT